MSAVTHRPLGETPIQIPGVVFGATCLGNLFVAMSDPQKHQLIAEWFAAMPKPVAIDTAGKYGAGLSLEVLGRELQALQIDPADVVLSNKLAWRRVPLTTAEPTFEPGVWIDIQHDAVQDISYDGIRRCYDDGCEMLGRYRPQMVSVHDPDEYLAAASDADDRRRRLGDIVDAYRALAQLRDAGQVAAVGIGAKDWRVIQQLDQHCEFDWVMMANSFTIMNHPSELLALIESLHQRRIAIINSAVMHGGFLVGGDFFDYRRIDPDDPADARRLRWRESFFELCRQYQQRPFDVAVAFGTSHPAITSVALSTSRPERVPQLVAAADAAPSAEFWQALQQQGLIHSDYTLLSDKTSR